MDPITTSEAVASVPVLLPVTVILSMFVLLPLIVIVGMVFVIKAATNNSGTKIGDLQRQLDDPNRRLEELRRKE